MPDEQIKVRFVGDAGSLEQASNRATATLGKFNKGSNEATQSLTNLSRVAQDAPYGFIGIANNINPLLESFQRLKTSTGSAGGAFKALASSMMGAGGLGLAVGVASSLLVVFGNRLFGAGKAAKDAANENKSYGDSVKEAFKSVAQEAAQVDVLIRQLKLETTSRQEKAGIMRELQRIAPEYFASLDKEKFTIEQVTAAYGGYLRSLKNVAEAKVLEKQLEDLIAKRLELEKILEPPQFVFDENGNKIRNFVLETAETLDLRNKRQAEYNNLLKAEGVTADRLARLKPPPVKPQDFTPPKPDKPKFETNFFDKFLSFDPTKVKSSSKEFAEAFTLAYEYALENKDIFVGLDKIVNFDTKESAVKEADKWWKDFQQGIFQIKPQPIDISRQFDTSVKTVDLKMKVRPLPQADFSELQKLQLSFAEQFQKLGEATGEGLGVAIGEGIGAAVSGGGLDELFKGIAASVGGFIQELGKMLIQAAVVAKAFKAVFAKLLANPAAALAVGVGLVAVGAVIKGMVPKFKGFNKGTWKVPGSGNTDSVPAMLTPGEMVIPAGMAERIRRQSGTNVSGTGGAGNMRIVGELRAHMRDLVASFALENQSQRRAFG